MTDAENLDYRDAIGRQFGNFVVVRELGRGAMGAVFIGYQRSLKRQVAIKLLPKALATSDMARQQFRDEAELVAILNHPNIITIFENGEDDLYFYQAMELVDGQDLGQLLNKIRRHPVPARRVLPLKQTLRLTGEILDGLGLAHEEGVVHQDLKPANILVDNRTGRARIADFGIAKARQIEYSARGLVVGTPNYLSPEQASAGDTDHRTDIYAMGLILLEMLAGQLPIRDEGARETVMRKIREPDSFLLHRPIDCHPNIDEDMEKIILTAIATDRDMRYNECTDFSRALDQWLRHKRQQASA